MNENIKNAAMGIAGEAVSEAVERKGLTREFVIECPSCGKYATAKNGIFGTSLFATKTVLCTCGYTINIKTDKMTSRICSHCGNDVIFDQTKGADAACPVCHEKINTEEDLNNMIQFNCPSCACELSVRSDTETTECPLCNTEIDVVKEYAKQTIKNKGQASVIKYEGGADTLVWKHPVEDFNQGSQLIVHQSQEAIFFRNGVAMDTLGAGKYALQPDVLPKLSEAALLKADNDMVFHSEVYFINKTTQMGLKWGTDSKVRFLDPLTGIPFEIGACGQFSLRVTDSRKLVMSLVGTLGKLTNSELVDDRLEASAEISPFGFGISIKESTAKFKAMLVTKIKSNIARCIKEKQLDLFEIDEHLDELSEELKKSCETIFTDYGLEMPDFCVMSILTPDDDPNFRRLKTQRTERYMNKAEEELKAEQSDNVTKRRLTEIENEKQLRNANFENESEMQMAEAEHKQKLKMMEAEGDIKLKSMQMEQEAELARIKAQYEAEAMKTKSMAEIEILKAKNEAEVEKIRAEALANAEGYRAQALAEAEEMHAKGYSYQQETSRQIGLKTLDNGGTGAASMIADATNLGVTMGAMSGVMSMTKDSMAPVIEASKEIRTSIGEMMNPGSWSCECGKTGITSKFCPECGKPKPQNNDSDTWNCTCGKTGITSNFCPECGNRKPEPPKPWNCVCGRGNILSKFCPECGSPKPTAWDCSCGKTGITSKFCPECGQGMK